MIVFDIICMILTLEHSSLSHFFLSMTLVSYDAPANPAPAVDAEANAQRDSPRPATPPQDSVPDATTEAPQFCDPDGLTDIRRSLSRLSNDLKLPRVSATPSALARFTDDILDLYADVDELTLTDVHVGDGQFDFEKFLRQLMRK